MSRMHDPCSVFDFIQTASDIMVPAGKVTITFPALDDLEDVGQG